MVFACGAPSTSHIAPANTPYQMTNILASAIKGRRMKRKEIGDVNPGSQYRGFPVNFFILSRFSGLTAGQTLALKYTFADKFGRNCAVTFSTEMKQEELVAKISQDRKSIKGKSVSPRLVDSLYWLKSRPSGRRAIFRFRAGMGIFSGGKVFNNTVIF